MKRLTVAAAALAAGMLTLVAQSRAEPERDTFGATGKAPAAPTKHAAEKGKEDAGSGKSVKAAGAGVDTNRTAKASKPKRVAAQMKRHKKARVKLDLEKPPVDASTTASIVRVRPELRAVARKAVIGLHMASAEVKSAGAPTYTAIVARYASSYGVPATLAHAVISVESNFSPNKVGGAGEIGLMQIKPATARLMGYSGSASGLYDPETNIKFGMKYLGKAHELSGGETCGTILRYNAGHGARRMNPVSAAYCSKVRAIIGG